MTDQKNRILPAVQKPARYTGGEWGEVQKEKEQVNIRVAFCFPDTYEIGMSNLGMRILYGVMNEQPDVWCERVFAPWGDMEEQLLDNIWGYEYIGDTRTVDVHVKRLREKIKDHAGWGITTVWGIGYKFEVRE